MDMKFKFLGGADMVGRMGMTMEGDDMSLLVEYGLFRTVEKNTIVKWGMTH